MTKWLAVLVVAACGKSDAPQRRPAGSDQASSAPAAAVDAAAVPQEMPAKGVANSAVESVPRKDWPCRYVQTLDSVDPNGTHIATTWEYGKRTHCWIPADVAGGRGLIGCPDKQVQKNLENKVEMTETYAYDADDHLHEVQTMAARFEYAWDGNLVRGFRLRDDVYPFRAIDHGIEIKDQNGTDRIELDQAGHIATYHSSIGSLDIEPTVFTWKGSHLVQLKQIGTTKVEYGCK